MNRNPTLRRFFQQNGLTSNSVLEKAETFFAEKNLQRNELHLKEQK